MWKSPWCSTRGVPGQRYGRTCAFNSRTAPGIPGTGVRKRRMSSVARVSRTAPRNSCRHWSGPPSPLATSRTSGTPAPVADRAPRAAPGRCAAGRRPQAATVSAPTSRAPSRRAAARAARSESAGYHRETAGPGRQPKGSRSGGPTTARACGAASSHPHPAPDVRPSHHGCASRIPSASAAVLRTSWGGSSPRACAEQHRVPARAAGGRERGTVFIEPQLGVAPGVERAVQRDTDPRCPGGPAMRCAGTPLTCTPFSETPFTRLYSDTPFACRPFSGGPFSDTERLQAEQHGEYRHDRRRADGYAPLHLGRDPLANRGGRTAEEAEPHQ